MYVYKYLYLHMHMYVHNVYTHTYITHIYEEIWPEVTLPWLARYFLLILALSYNLDKS